MTTHAHPMPQTNFRQRLHHLVHRLEHILPGQAPLKDFVHHNTLHGYQHLPFAKALSEAKRMTGIHGFWSLAHFRQALQQQRITRRELEDEIQADPELEAQRTIALFPWGSLLRLDIYRTALIYDLKPITRIQLQWRKEEQNAMQTFHPDLDLVKRHKLLQAAGTSEKEAVSSLWQTCLKLLQLENQPVFHPEELHDLTPELAQQLLQQWNKANSDPTLEHRTIQDWMRKENERLINRLFGRVGAEITLRSMLFSLTGENILELIRPLLLRHLAAFLDHGMASWRAEHKEHGFYYFWRYWALKDLSFLPEEMPDWRDEIESFPTDPIEAIVMAFQRMGLAEKFWESYLERLALELPGWSGMMMWRQSHPGYQSLTPDQVDILDYLAVRLLLERLYAIRLCRKLWLIEPRLEILRHYFFSHEEEFLTRWVVHNESLPEYLASSAQRLLHQSIDKPPTDTHWRSVAQNIHIWRHISLDRNRSHSEHRHAWPLFLLAQHLGLSAQQWQLLTPNQLQDILACLDRLDDARSGYLWLQAYERHYRDQILHALLHNHGRGRWAKRDHPPAGHIVFCMDEREEGIRRHLEACDPEIETLGAAGFFGIPVHWKGLDDTAYSAMCPVVVTPAHTVCEHPRPEAKEAFAVHQQRHHHQQKITDYIHQGGMRGLIAPLLVIASTAFAALGLLAGTLLFPLTVGRWLQRLRHMWDPPVATQTTLTAQENTPATKEQPREGFTDQEQIDRVAGFLRMVGLTYGFGPLVILMGHGSISRNNPHLAAYDCGACSGRHGGPNARLFAQMANRPPVRAGLRQQNIIIPEQTWFIGAEHNTGNESIDWYDEDQIPAHLTPIFTRTQQALAIARHHSAHERCRRLVSAPRQPSLTSALKHMQGRAMDISQARPELGHATNAVALIGRRSVSQGLFLDRRMFLISYDPTQDPTGAIVESILINAGPVGAGISLEYYFSTVDNDRFGCGSKITHNVVGLFGVMEGASSDLRTGLPKQMIEIHEAMRLLVVVEQRPALLTTLYQRQPILQELVGNGWLHLAAIDPQDGRIHLFKPGLGWQLWHASLPNPPTVHRSADWYQGYLEPRPPAMIVQPGETLHA